MPKPTSRQVTAPPGRFFRLHLHPRRVLMLKLLHNGLLDTIARGEGTEVSLWELAAMALTWSRTAEILGEGEAQILPMLELATRMVTRWRDTGRVAFEGDEYEVACQGTMVMDELAARTDAATATAATYWSEAQLLVLRTVAEAEAFARGENVGAKRTAEGGPLERPVRAGSRSERT